MSEELLKSKEEDILKLKKLAVLFKNECKKLKEENENLKKSLNNETKETEGSSSNDDVTSQLKIELNRRMVIEQSYKKLKEFTLLIEEKMKNQKNEHKEEIKKIQEKMNEYANHVKKSKEENELMKRKIEEKETLIFKLSDKIEEFRKFFKEKNIPESYEKKIEETTAYKMEIKKLKEHLESLKKVGEITTKERQQYKSMIMLCSQYKEKCKIIPKLESKIDILENQVKEYELYKIRNAEKVEEINELKNENIKYQIENNKFKDQIEEWVHFSKSYINSEAADIDSLKKSMNEIFNKYNQLNFNKTDMEVKFRKLTIELDTYKQNLDDKKLELRILENKYKQIEKKLEFVKKEYANEVSKNQKTTGASGSSNTITNSNDPTNDIEKNTNLLKLVSDYKIKYEAIKNDNEEKEKLLEELQKTLQNYKNEFENMVRKQKNAEEIVQEKALFEGEKKFLQEEINNYKNKLSVKEKDLQHMKNQWNSDNEKNEEIIKKLKETIKIKEMEHKLSSTKIKENSASEMCPDISVLYKNIDSLNTYDEIVVSNLQNEIMYLKSKIEVIKFFYSNQIKNYREAFLYILGWDIQIEQNDDEIFFILTSLFSTHDGQYVFIKNKCVNEKRAYTDHNDNVQNLKKIKVENEGIEKEKDEQVNKREQEEKPKDVHKNEEEVSDNLNKESKEIEENMKGPNESDQYYEQLLGDKNMINTNVLIEKTNFENTNINLATIMKGCNYNLLLNGYYSVKWQENNTWRNYINKINSYPILLSLSCIEEYNHIKAQYNPNMSKNFKGMLFRI